MHRRVSLMTGVVLLIAGGAILYAYRSSHPALDTALAHSQKAQEQEAGSTVKAESDVAKESGTQAPAPKATTSTATASGSQVLYDLNALPDPAKRMLDAIGTAAASGDLEKLRPVLETNELKPLLASTDVGDPIAYWKKESADGNGRAVMAALLNVISAGFVKVGNGKGPSIYVWPYFAEMDLTKLSPAQEIEFYRLVPAEEAAGMRQSGKYTYYRVGIGADGVWHYFKR